jgi:aminocarboxymuconate-semialdehyde decarboxylase
MGLPEPHAQMGALDAVRRKRIFCDNPQRLIKETTR